MARNENLKIRFAIYIRYLKQILFQKVIILRSGIQGSFQWMGDLVVAGQQQVFGYLLP